MRGTAVKNKIEPSLPADFAAAPEAAVVVKVAADGVEPVTSPARDLQARLESDYADLGAQDRRWPLYVALPFWAGLSSLVWAGIGVAAWALIRHH